MAKRTVSIAVVLLTSFIVPLAALAADNKDDAIKTFVTILPQAYLVERIGGEHVKVSVLVGPGRGPHDYEPTPKQLSDLAQARILFTVGVPFEDRLWRKIGPTFKNLTMVQSQKGIELRTLTEEESDSAHHEPKERTRGSQQGKPHKHHGHSHDAGSEDPHIWLDPVVAKTIAANICEGLVQVDPGRGREYRENLKKLQEDLDEVNRKLAQDLAPFKGQEFFVFHPAFGYFAQRYGLKQVAVEIEGKQPTAKQLANLIEKARKTGVKAIFVQPQFSQTSAERIAASTGATVVPMDPLSKDYLKNLTDMGAALSQAMSGQKQN